MKPAVALVLLVVSVALGVWWFSPAPPSPAPPAPTARPGERAAAPEDRSPATAAEPAVTPEPSPLPAPPAPPPAATADGVALREEADRLIAEGRILEGLDAMRKATAADPSARNHGDLGSLLARLTALDEALIHLRRAAELDPGNADRWIALANAYYRKVELGEAWKAERRAREAEPGLVLGRDGGGLRIRKNDSAAGSK
jgi:tetratricopeptide (TPR) repeat protein